MIRQQADRCRDILRSMGRAGKDDLHLRQAPLPTVIEEAADPHRDRGKRIHFDIAPEADSQASTPSILRRPELIHGMRNLVQNAVDFASANVWVEARWSEKTIAVRIMDDGQGYAPQVIGRIGNPFMRRRRTADEPVQRPGYEGMGMGLFIAKTLLERTGAELTFANGTDRYALSDQHAERTGAVVEVLWPREKIDAVAGDTPVPAGENRLIEI